ncbi:MAG: DUF3305 domain-containing protein [Hydrogenophaga sp.]|nr:DUF3305 domain-containing protein [Hydrogenophaga sp.]
MQAESLTAVAGHPALNVAVVMRREPLTGPMARWQTWRWVLADVVPMAEPVTLPTGVSDLPPPAPREVEPLPGATMVDGARWFLFEPLRVELFRDDVEGHFLNLESPSPCFWVLWRADEKQMLDGEPMAVPLIVTLSYHDAGRWLDVQEKVEQVPAPEPVIHWLQEFVSAHFKMEPKRRKRPESFKPLTDRFGQPVRVTTDKLRRDSGANGESA